MIRLDQVPTLSQIQQIYGNPGSNAIYYIIKEAIAIGVNESDEISYVLATAKHETYNFQYMQELYNGDPVEYFNNKYGNRTDIGNRPDTNDGYDYRGRGYVQLTGRANYETMGNALGINLLDNPDLAADPAIAAQIIVYGMLHGSFTGKSISDYINEEGTDYYNARRIVNGTGQATTIANYASSYDIALEGALPTLAINYTIDFRNESGDHVILGGIAQNKLYGGDGNDLLDGGLGNDMMDGGEGVDTVTYAARANIKALTISEKAVAPLSLIDSSVDERDIIVNVEKIILTSGDDNVRFSLLDNNSAVKEIHTGGGADVISINGQLYDQRPVIFLGDGDDTLNSSSGGVIIYGEGGNDTFHLGKDILIADATSDDEFRFGGQLLTGGTRSKGSESQYSHGINGERYAVNQQGELGIIDVMGNITYVANYNTALDVAHPGDILLAEVCAKIQSGSVPSAYA